VSFGIEYHKDQDIDAPFEKSEAIFFMTSAFMFTMQKDLSDWIDTSKIVIDDSVSNVIKKSISSR